MATVTMIRHGQGSFGTDNYDRLSELGHWQARVVGEHFQRAGVVFDRVHCGALRRQRETADAVLGSMGTADRDYRIDAAFDEYPTKPVFARYMPELLSRDDELRGEFARDRSAAGRDRALARRVFFPVLSAWQDDPSAPDLESFAAFRGRVSDALAEVAAMAEHGRRDVVVTSAGVIAVAVLNALELPDSAFARLAWQVHNASVSTLTVDPTGLGLLQFNGVAHLEASGRADALTWL